MDFGKLADISQVDFALPAANASQVARWKATPHHAGKPPKLYMGCPSWSCKAWMGKIYPPGTKPDQYLKAYARHFNAIELNTTYYRTPDAGTLARWMEAVPADFRFCPKISQQISHYRRLRLCKGLAETFCQAFAPLGEQLGQLFLQLPPNFTTAELPHLAAFLENFPKGYPLAVELRHESWFADAGLWQELMALADSLGVTLLITDVAGRRDVLHLSLTTPRPMIRFVGNALHPSDFRRIDDWISVWQQWEKDGVEEIWFFVHQPEEITCPELIAHTGQLVRQRLGWQATLPVLIQKHAPGLFG